MRNTSFVTTAIFLLLQSAIVAGRYLRSSDPNTADRQLQADNFPFIEENGLVVMEAESVPLVGFWEEETIYNGYTGSGHIRFDGNTIYGGGVNSTLSYFIQINNPGSYVMTYRARKNNTRSDLSNDCYIRMVGYPGDQGTHEKAFLDGFPGRFRWGGDYEVDHSGVTPIFNLVKGTYEFQVSGRSKHFVLDRIVFYNPDFLGPREAESTGLPESPRLDGPGAPPSALQNLQLTDAGTGSFSILRNIQDGDVIALNEVGTSLSILADTFGEVGSVLFEYDGGSRSEGGAPYALNGGSNEDNNPVPYLAFSGVKTITATVFDDNGNEIAKETVSFTLIDGTSAPTPAPQSASPVVPPPPTAGPLSFLELVSADGNSYSVLQNLRDGDVLDQSVFGTQLSVLATVTSPVSAVHFLYGGKTWKESLAIYAMAGNQGNEVFPVTYLATTGSKTLTVKAFIGGNEVDSVTVNFEIVERIESPVAAPTQSPVVAPTESPVVTPTESPVVSPTESPVVAPTTAAPVDSPVTTQPASAAPVASSPIPSPTKSPVAAPVSSAPVSAAPVTAAPVVSPTSAPVVSPTSAPVVSPTSAPVPALSTPAPTKMNRIVSLDLTTAQFSVDNFIQTLNNGDIIDSSVTGSSLSVLAQVSGPDIRKVTFVYGSKRWTEGLPPYAMAGNNGADNLPVAYLSTPGAKSLTVMIFDRSGIQLDDVTVNFNIA